MKLIPLNSADTKMGLLQVLTSMRIAATEPNSVISSFLLDDDSR